MKACDHVDWSFLYYVRPDLGFGWVGETCNMSLEWLGEVGKVLEVLGKVTLQVFKVSRGHVMTNTYKLKFS